MVLGIHLLPLCEEVPKCYEPYKALFIGGKPLFQTGCFVFLDIFYLSQ